MWFVLFNVGLPVLGFIFGWYGARLFPKYPPGTTVAVSLAGEIVRCSYIRRTSVWHHDVRVLPGDYLGWSGREISTTTSKMWRPPDA